MTKTEALKLTLEELFAYQHLVDSEWGSCRSNEQIEIDGDTNPVITALKEVLAQPEQEPNGYVQTVIEALYENGDPVSVDAAELLQRITAQPDHIPDAGKMVEQEPVGLDEDTLRDMAGSAFETAMAFGISTDSFERLARDVNKRIVAALVQPEPEQEPFKPDWLSYRQGKLDGAAEAKFKEKNHD